MIFSRQGRLPAHNGYVGTFGYASYYVPQSSELHMTPAFQHNPHVGAFRHSPPTTLHIEAKVEEVDEEEDDDTVWVEAPEELRGDDRYQFLMSQALLRVGRMLWRQSK